MLPSSRWLPESRAEHPRRLDVAGLVLLAAALTLLVSALTESRSGLSASTLLLFAGSAVALAAYAVVEGRVAEPMIDLALLRTPGFLAATLGALVLGAGVIAMTSNVPTLVQLGLGGSLWTATWLITGLVGHQRRHLPARTPRPDPVGRAGADRDGDGRRRERASCSPWASDRPPAPGGCSPRWWSRGWRQGC